MKLQQLSILLALSALCLGAQTPPPQGETEEGTGGVIVGTVFDAATGQPVRGATVFVSGEPELRTTTDTAGRFRIPVPLGTYNLRFTSETHNDTAVEQVSVSSSEPIEASTVMAAKGTLTSVEVTERVDAISSTAEAALAERKLAPVVSDAITSEEISKSTAADAASALQKVTGVSVVGDGFVYVRGLGERYSATMLNNAMITTTEPEKRVVPLDMFPAGLIENVKVLKTYTPDLPGEFSGGLVQLSTVEFPSQRYLRVGVGVGFNTNTSFENFLADDAGLGDFFGFGSGSRALPDAIPRDRKVVVGSFSKAELERLGESFDADWEPELKQRMRPSQSWSIVGGDTFGKLGVVGALTLSNEPQFTPEFQQYNRFGSAGTIPFNVYPDYDSYLTTARMGAVLNLAYKFTPSQKVSLKNTLTRDADREFRRFSGYNNDLGTDIVNTRSRYIERSLYSTQLQGEHLLARVGGTILNWQVGFSRATRDEPDLREITRAVGSNGVANYTNTNESGLRFFNDLEDRSHDPAVAISKPFYRGSVSGILKFGVRATIRDREFNARRFRFFPVQLGTIDRSLPGNLLFGPENIRPNGFELREDTRLTDAYTADLRVFAGFAMVDMAFGPRWRFVGGVRIEDADQRVVTIDPLTTSGKPIVARLTNRDPLPAANLIYALTTRQNLRFGYSRTVSRPDFRELSPFEFTNVAGGFTAIGNPNLLRATIDNYDVRWEYFPSGDQLIALSYFYKDFTNPIESTIEATNALRQSYLNAEGARNQGLEAEFRRNLRWLTPTLSAFTVGSNFTFVDSSVTIPEDQRNVLTTLERPLVGQSRYIFNGNIEWVNPKWRSQARLFANYVSSRITDVGAFRLPDIVQQPNIFLDAVYQVNLTEDGKLSMRFSAENLANNEYRFTQGSQPFRNYRIGRTFSIGTSFTIF